MRTAGEARPHLLGFIQDLAKGGDQLQPRAPASALVCNVSKRRLARVEKKGAIEPLWYNFLTLPIVIYFLQELMAFCVNLGASRRCHLGESVCPWQHQSTARSRPLCFRSPGPGSVFNNLN